MKIRFHLLPKIEKIVTMVIPPYLIFETHFQ
jgi:hypothetical protein